MSKKLPFLLLLLLLPSCMASDADKKSLQQGFADYNARHLDSAESAADNFIKKNPNVDSVDEAYYLRALARLGRGDKTDAAADLNVALQKSKRPDLTSKANRALGDIAFDSQQWSLAQADYQKAIAAVPGGNNDPYLNYRLGACLQSQAQWDLARPCFQHVIALNSSPTLTQRSIDRMNARYFCLQFAAFTDPRKASELKTQLAAAKITASITTQLSEGKLLYLVRANSYPTFEQAEAARSQLLPKYPMLIVFP